MEMRVEIIDGFTLPTILDWWVVRGLGAMDTAWLPPVGYVASDREGPAAAAWLYQPHGCRVAILDWLVNRPHQRQSNARQACRLVFEAIAARALEDGAQTLFASVERDGMVTEALACGFHVASTGNTHLVKHL